MIESFFVAGAQNVPPEGPKSLVYGQSITDKCVDFDTTLVMLDDLNAVSTNPRTTFRHFR